MSFQAYLDNIEEKTKQTPQEIIDKAKLMGFTSDTKAGEILDWLSKEFGLGRGHGMALIYVFKNGTKISNKHVGKGGSHNDESNELVITGNKKK